MSWYPRGHIETREVQKFVIIFYLVGFAGFMIPFTNPVFRSITPLAIIMCIYLLAVYHRSLDIKSIAAFLIIFSVSFLVEVAGVNTGLIFGSYAYGRSLGPAVFNTPLLIGLNWVFLVYTSTSVMERLKLPQPLKIILAAGIMVGYDLVLEQTAPLMDMWSFEGPGVPVRNYLSWFILSVIFISLLKIIRVDTRNELALILLSGQFAFMTALMIFL